LHGDVAIRIDNKRSIFRHVRPRPNAN
jgi:hypothetical protein